MADPTATEVRAVIATGLSDADIDAVIPISVTMFDATIGASEVSAAVELDIKRWLAAHFISLKDAQTRLITEKIGEVRADYTELESASANGLSLTRWGQMAIVLDPTGNLKKLADDIPTTPRMYAL